MKNAALIILLAAILGIQIARLVIKPTVPPAPVPDWRADLKAKLPALGHRNWIVIADSAYPSQSREGVTTIVTEKGQKETLTEVLKMLGECKHVKPVIYEDRELESVSDDDAKGVLQYQMDLKAILGEMKVKTESHETLISMLDEAAKKYNVIILKTDMTIPYTSVFINLDCAYWDADKEKKLREAMTKK